MSDLHLFEKSCDLPVNVQTVFDWHKRDDAFPLMTPKFPPVRVLQRDGGITNGARTTVRVGPDPIAFTWTLEHCDYIEGKQFCDKQVSGPFGKWYHMHMFEPIDERHCRLTDRIEYVLPPAANPVPGASLIVNLQLNQMFHHRHKLLRKCLTGGL